jgi:hypothetical protein
VCRVRELPAERPLLVAGFGSGLVFSAAAGHPRGRPTVKGERGGGWVIHLALIHSYITVFWCCAAAR